MIIQCFQFSRLIPFRILWTYAMDDGNYLLFRFKWIFVNNGCYLNMNFQNEVFGLARVRIGEVRINEGLLYFHLPNEESHEPFWLKTGCKMQRKACQWKLHSFWVFQSMIRPLKFYQQFLTIWNLLLGQYRMRHKNLMTTW